MCRVKSARFVDSVFAVEALVKHQLPEIAFVGRSNVGKSSLLNALVNQTKLAQTSRTPGRTKSLNYFEITLEREFEPEPGVCTKYDTQIHFVDLPGYGYAEQPKHMREQWKKLIGGYLLGRELLNGLLLLIDCRRDVGEQEFHLAELGRGGNLAIVLTKGDKLSKNDLARRRRQIAEDLAVNVEDVIVTSLTGKEKRPVDDVRERICRFLG